MSLRTSYLTKVRQVCIFVHVRALRLQQPYELLSPRLADLRHQVLQLAVVFACSINQLSPGAFLLRRDLFPAIVTVGLNRPPPVLSLMYSQKIIKSPETQTFTFEASLLLSIVANFHRTDAAKLNPYLRSMKETEDREMLKSLCYSVNFTMDTVIKYVPGFFSLHFTTFLSRPVGD